MTGSANVASVTAWQGETLDVRLAGLPLTAPGSRAGAAWWRTSCISGWRRCSSGWRGCSSSSVTAC